MSNPFYLQRKANKYGASKTVFQGRLYDSKGEAGLATEIDILLKSGLVVKVEPQITFKLYGKNGGKICTHRPDFLLTFKDGHQEAWEYKGFATAIWKIKRDLFVDNYPDIQYVVITPRETYYAKKLKR